MTDKRKRANARRQRAGDAIVRAGVPVAATAIAGPVGPVALGVLQFAAAELLGWYREAEQHRGRDWFEGFCWRFHEMSREDAERELASRAKDPHVRAAVVETVRRAMTAVDEAAVQLLGRLSADYSELPHGRPRDAFFTAMCRFLADVDAREIESAQLLLTAAASLLEEHDRTKAARGETVFVHAQREAPVVVRTFAAGERTSDRWSESAVESDRDLRRLFRVLKSSGLAHDVSVWGADPPRMLDMDRDVATRMLDLLGSPAAP